MWSFGNDDSSSIALSNHLSNTPSILYPFIVIGPSMLFIGLSLHALSFIKKHPISVIMVIIGAPFVGLSNFVWKNGNLMLLSCVIFVAGLTLLLYQEKYTSKVL